MLDNIKSPLATLNSEWASSQRIGKTYRIVIVTSLIKIAQVVYKNKYNYRCGIILIWRRNYENY